MSHRWIQFSYCRFFNFCLRLPLVNELFFTNQLSSTPLSRSRSVVLFFRLNNRVKSIKTCLSSKANAKVRSVSHPCNSSRKFFSVFFIVCQRKYTQKLNDQEWPNKDVFIVRNSRYIFCTSHQNEIIFFQNKSCRQHIVSSCQRLFLQNH